MRDGSSATDSPDYQTAFTDSLAWILLLDQFKQMIMRRFLIGFHELYPGNIFLLKNCLGVKSQNTS